ncbi:MAG: SUMF1/EgtB/PvdO family nonheme iron enzyme, partial [Acidobacteria bacterium]|nr:SUMF1/EgtB/PvdO family nonheme iron enzyme [Acidobacteriota bacterium]
APKTPLIAQLDVWLQDLEVLLEDLPDYRGQVRRAIEQLQSSEALVRNYSQARAKYVAAVRRLHGRIRFAGTAEVSGPDQVGMDRVFVLPRVAPVEERSRKDMSGRPADCLLREKDRRVVVLGAAGSGKTTLVECFALASTPDGGGMFSWAESLPELLPVVCRVRDLVREMDSSFATLWDYLRFRCGRAMGEAPQAGFLPWAKRQSGLLVLFDGLDEAGTPERRLEVVELISAFADTLSPRCRVLVTSRPHDYAGRRFPEDAWRHVELCEFDDPEIRTFVGGWAGVHVADRSEADARAAALWHRLENRKDILAMARNALLLTMMVRVHFGLGQLPDSRLQLYEKCAETLLKYWTEAKGLGESELDYYLKQKFLGCLAFDLQGEAGAGLDPDVSLKISRDSLRKRLDEFLKGECSSASVENVIDRLVKRDAILVSDGSEFSFVHRSFQEYFAAWWMKQEISPEKFREMLFDEKAGWNETLYLAVAQLDNRPRRAILLDLLANSRAELALGCVLAKAGEEPWLMSLTEFLSKYTLEGQEYEQTPATTIAGRADVIQVVEAIFRQRLDGRVLRAAVELADALHLGDLTESFFAEGAAFQQECKMVRVDDFLMDRFLVTNRDFERMVPGHRALRDRYSDSDEQPVIYVNWFEAGLFAAWRGCRLPTEGEWEKAASWDPAKEAKRTYPWGDEFDPSRCNTRESESGKTTPVRGYPSGASAYGCYDMAGNVWEWTDSVYQKGQPWRVLRGGSWDNYRSFAACAYRYNVHPFNRNNLIGFRCARTYVTL